MILVVHKRGKHYFYNDSGRSVWELDELPVEEESKHFINAYDGDLGTFNNIYNRLSRRFSTDGEEVCQAARMIHKIKFVEV